MEQFGKQYLLKVENIKFNDIHQQIIAKLGILDYLTEYEMKEIHGLFEAKFPFCSFVESADCIHVHIRVDDTKKLPCDKLTQWGGKVENQKDGYLKYTIRMG